MKKLNVFLALVSVVIFSLSFVSEAQTMNNDQTLRQALLPSPPLPPTAIGKIWLPP